MIIIFRSFIVFLISCIPLFSYSQENIIESFLSDSSLIHASVSLCFADSETGSLIVEYDSDKSLIPASVMKLVTSAAALELLGPQHTFKTVLGYTGSLNKETGILTGNILIKGGGDPSLGSKYFPDNNNDFISTWISEIKQIGIKRINGGVVTDDSYYDFLPVPAKWLWEDIGNYYGAGAFGLSVFDNSCQIHLNSSSDSSMVALTGVEPKEYSFEFTNYLISSGSSDEGYVFAAPYNNKGWIAGSIPYGLSDYVIKGSITDPPLLIAKIVSEKLESEGISVSEKPFTLRTEPELRTNTFIIVSEITSPPLSDIIEVLNHESVNLYAEHLVKELGKNYNNSGSTAAGINVIINFLKNAGIKTEGFFIEDGSGNSPLNSINSRELVSLLIYMKNKGKYFPVYLSSLPVAGKEGTIKYIFRDPLFESRLKAKSGSMTRVRNYAGYVTTLKGKILAFTIIVNNYHGPLPHLISHIEKLLKEIILNN